MAAPQNWSSGKDVGKEGPGFLHQPGNSPSAGNQTFSVILQLLTDRDVIIQALEVIQRTTNALSCIAVTHSTRFAASESSSMYRDCELGKLSLGLSVSASEPRE